MTPPPQEENAAQQQMGAIRNKVTKLCEKLDDEKEQAKRFREASNHRNRITQSRLLYYSESKIESEHQLQLYRTRLQANQQVNDHDRVGSCVVELILDGAGGDLVV